MTNTQDAIAAFLAKGGKIVKHSADKRTLTEGQIYAAMRDETPKPKVIETLRYPAEGIPAMLQSLWNECYWDNDKKTASYRRTIANYMAMLDAALANDKALWLDTNNSYWKNCVATAMRNISNVLSDCDSMSNDTYRAINAAYHHVTDSKMDLI